MTIVRSATSSCLWPIRDGAKPVNRDTKISDLENQRSIVSERAVEAQGQRRYAIVAPVTGRVTGINARRGYPVDGRQALMKIVPSGVKLTVQLFVSSSSIAFIKPGQTVRLLYDAFPYQRFGSQTGIVQSISSTTLLPSEVTSPFKFEQPVYLVFVSMDRQSIPAYGHQVALQPGMTLIADIVLETRSVFAWVFDPLLAVRGRL